jgi:hypothetical protein
MSELLLPRHMRPSFSGPDNVLIYFERVPDGRLIVPPVAHAPTPKCRLTARHERSHPGCLCGYVRREVSGARELEKISKRYEQQKRDDFAKIDEAHYNRIAAKMKEIRSRLNHQMANARSNREKDLIRYALKRLEEGEKNWGPRRIEAHLHIEEG